MSSYFAQCNLASHFRRLYPPTLSLFQPWTGILVALFCSDIPTCCQKMCLYHFTALRLLTTWGKNEVPFTSRFLLNADCTCSNHCHHFHAKSLLLAASQIIDWLLKLSLSWFLEIIQILLLQSTWKCGAMMTNSFVNTSQSWSESKLAINHSLTTNPYIWEKETPQLWWVT